MYQVTIDFAGNVGDGEGAGN
jgi:hypothetical protein